MRNATEIKPSILSRLDAYLPGIKAGFDKTPQSLLSMMQFESVWEAFFVTASYVVISAIISIVLKFLIGWIATLALLVAVGTLLASLILQMGPKSLENQQKVEMLLNIGLKATAVFLLISFVPAFLTLGMICVAIYRSMGLMKNLIPESGFNAVQQACISGYEKVKTAGISAKNWFSAEKAQDETLVSVERLKFN